MIWQPRPAEGFYASTLPSLNTLPIRTFLPTGYEPAYPYPLIVFFHGNHGSEEQVLNLAPRISRRNHIIISLRGPESLGPDATGRASYGWGGDDSESLIQEYTVRAIEQTRRNYHVHSERIYLAGFWEGATLAYRLGFAMPDRISGVISLNGSTPRPHEGEPLFRFPDVRQLRVMIAHGARNTSIPLENARRDFRMLYSAGVDVQFHTYPTCTQLHPHMLRDLNRWVIDNLTNELDRLHDIEAD